VLTSVDAGEMDKVTGRWLADHARKDGAPMVTSRGAGMMTAAGLNRQKRNRWRIENQSHYPRDTGHREDHGQAWAGESPRALASLRSLTTGLMRIKGYTKIKETTEWVAENRDRAACSWLRGAMAATYGHLGLALART
jgi:hypothetical protein